MTAMSTEDLLQRLRALKSQIKARFRVRELELFGSFAREGQGDRSDIDVLVDFEEGADLFDMAGLALFLEEELQQDIDVVPKRALRAELREAVLREAVTV